MKLSPLFHPFLFLLASVVFLYHRSSVLVLIAPAQMFRPLLVLAVLLAIFTGPAFLVVRDIKWTGILLTIFVLGICSNEDFAIVVICNLVVAAIFLIWRGYPVNTDRAVNLLNLVGLFLVMFYGYSVFITLPALPQSYYSNIDQIAQAPQLSSSSSLPDIYYIVLDGYGRADVLQELYQFDNSEFLRFLETKGFIIPSESRSNYPRTVLSVTSTLNMDYVQNLTPGLDDNVNWWLMSPLIDHSRVRVALENIGYQSISIATDWGITDNPTTDVYYSPKLVTLSDFEDHLLTNTPLVVIKPFLSEFALVSTYPLHRDLLIYDFATLSKIPEIPDPKFTFAHIIAPHPPFVFDSEGNPLTPSYPFALSDANDFPLDHEHYRQGYIGQLEFVNHQLERVIESIINDSETPPIIILQADHGPGMFFDFASAKSTCLKARFSTFAAYYLPGMDQSAVPNDITPVNLFRIIFNEYFDAKMPVLDRFHYYDTSAYIYDAEDVTQVVDSCSLP